MLDNNKENGVVLRSRTSAMTRANQDPILYGFGTTMDPFVKVCDGDPVKVAVLEGSVVLAALCFSIACSGPAIVVTVPLTLISGVGLLANSLMVCNGYKPTEPQPVDLPPIPADQNCMGCAHSGPSSDPAVGWCYKFNETIAGEGWCDHFSYREQPVAAPQAIPVPTYTAPPQPVAAVPPRAIEREVVPAQPVVIERPSPQPRPIGVRPDDEEINLANLFAPEPVKLSPEMEIMHNKLQAALKSQPQGYACALLEVIDKSGQTEQVVIGWFSELEEKRSSNYEVSLNPMKLRVLGGRRAV